MRRPVFPGVDQMKELILLLTFIAFMIIGSSVSAADFTAADLKIDAIKQTLEVQLERIRKCHGKGRYPDEPCENANCGAAEIVVRELTRQLEVLEHLREQLSAGAGDSQQTIDQFKSDWTQLLGTAFTEINSQVSQTNNLISQMETLRNSFGDSPGSDPTVISQGPQPSGMPVPTLTDPACVSPAPTTTAPTIVSPGPTSTEPTIVSPAPTTTAPTVVSPAPTAPTTGST